jgi:outer membrane protein OmpA-like peptidoglycan-associated protein
MTTSLRSWFLMLTVASCLLWAPAAGAQTTSTTTTSAQQPSTAESSDASRPATTTFYGDTGLWFVPTAEVLPAGKWSASGYRRGTNFIQGYTNVGDFAGTFAVGIANRAEVFGSFLFDTRIDRDVVPRFVNDPSFGGLVDRYPRVLQGWTGDNIGDFYLGVKVNLWSQHRQNPAAIAVRGLVKLPTGKDTIGTSTGKADVSGDLIVSKEFSQLVEWAGHAGYEYRGNPDGPGGLKFDFPTGAFNWGTGVTFPSRNFIRVVGELNGYVPSKNTATISNPVALACAPVNCGSLAGDDGSRAPLVSNVEKLTRATVGVTVQAKNGVFVGGGVSWNVPTQARDLRFTDADEFGDYFDWQVRVGYHPGVRTYAPPPPPTQPPPPPVTPQNRPPTVRARCEPCTVEVGKTSTVTADAQDPDGDVLTYRWTAPTGTFQQPADRQTIWTAPMQEGPVPVTVTVNDGHGGTASDSVTIQVVRPARKEYTFEDVHFDFDRYSLRPEATRLLDEAVAALRQDPTLRITVEGHTCNIGTAEYNLALGERRANSVRDYFISNGIPANRLQTVSYGEERPKYDNAREETRRLNRRAALVVKIQ